MSTRKIVGLVLIACGVLALVYGSFVYTKKTHELDLGVAELKVQEKERVTVPQWAGVAAVVVGAALLFIGKK